MGNKSLRKEKFWTPSSVWNSSLYDDPKSNKKNRVYEILEEIEMHNIFSGNILDEVTDLLKGFEEKYQFRGFTLRLVGHSYYDGHNYNHEYYLVGERPESEIELKDRLCKLIQEEDKISKVKTSKEEKERKDYERLKNKFEK